MLRTGCDPDNIRSKQSLWIIGMDPDMRGVKHKIDYSIGPLLLCCWKRQNEMAASLIPAVERVYHRSIQEAEKTFLTSLESWCLFGRQQIQEWMPNCEVCDLAQFSFSYLKISEAFSDCLAQHWSVTTLNFTLSLKSSGAVRGTNKTLSETISKQATARYFLFWFWEILVKPFMK